MGGMECSFLYSPSKNGAWIESLQSQPGMLNNSEKAQNSRKKLMDLEVSVIPSFVFQSGVKK